MTQFKNPYSNVFQGYCPDLGHSVRSGAEANVERVFNYFIAQRLPIKYIGTPLRCEYEPRVFTFDKYKKNNEYRPDWLLIGTDGERYVEYKGRLSGRDAAPYKTKLRHWFSCYPELARKTLFICGDKKTEHAIRCLYKGSQDDICVWQLKQLEKYGPLSGWKTTDQMRIERDEWNKKQDHGENPF